MFSDTIKVPVDTLLENAARIADCTDEQSGIFDRISNTLQSLRGSKCWEGAAWVAAAERVEEDKEMFSEVIAEMNELSEFLKAFAEKMAAKDEELRKRIVSV